MLHRALYMHWRVDGRMPDGFYFMSDKEAAMMLLSSPVTETRHLMAKMAKQQWYPILYEQKFEGGVSARMHALAADPLGRHALADRMATELGVQQHHFCTIVECGRDRRRITVPFLKSDGEHVRDDEDPSAPVWRVMVWGDSRHEDLRPAIADFIKQVVL
jgi:hypothetical protein